MSEFMKPAEIASLLGVTERRVYQLMESGQIDYIGRRPRRISRESIGRYLENRWPLLIDFMDGRVGSEAAVDRVTTPCQHAPYR